MRVSESFYSNVNISGPLMLTFNRIIIVWLMFLRHGIFGILLTTLSEIQRRQKEKFMYCWHVNTLRCRDRETSQYITYTTCLL